MVQKVVLLGAGGKMGMRITPNIKDDPSYEITYVEVSEQAAQALKKNHGVVSTSSSEPVKTADMVVFAVPDKIIKKVSASIVPLMKAGAMVIGLDPAAHFGGVMAMREDMKFFVVHPCHPSLFPFEEGLSLAAQRDWFGGTGDAKMDMVCAIHQGSDDDYERGEAFARLMFKPIDKSFRLTIDQMILLEPALVESITAPLIKGMRMAVDACVEKGVPRDAVMSFVMGHLKVQFGVLFDFAGFPFSDGANLALRNAMDVIFKPDWIEKIMSKEAIEKSVYDITHELSDK
ncbi:MAG: phosphogluconate dehydrogenase C-terminal domain-containing protein [Christensenellales bacterium]|jgi:hypothetical protein